MDSTEIQKRISDQLSHLEYSTPLSIKEDVKKLKLFLPTIKNYVNTHEYDSLISEIKALEKDIISVLHKKTKMNKEADLRRIQNSLKPLLRGITSITE